MASTEVGASVLKSIITRWVPCLPQNNNINQKTIIKVMLEKNNYNEGKIIDKYIINWNLR